MTTKSNLVLVSLAAAITTAVLSGQSALEQLKTYTDAAPSPAKGAPALAKGPAGNLPDIIGIRLGMPLREAFTILQTAHPKEKLGTSAVNLPGIEKPVLSDFFFDTPYFVEERVHVYVTPPPNQQVVWKVTRQLARQKIYRANVLSSLREKYGKETATSPLVTNDEQLTDMWWFLDEQGRPVKLPPPRSNFADGVQMAGDCAGQLGGSWFAPNNLERTLDYLDSPRYAADRRWEWCYSAGIGIHANVSLGEIATALQVEIFHYPLAMRSGRAEMGFVNNVARRQQQQEINQSKQARPKL